MLLKLYLRIIGIFLCTAFFAVLMPTSWMAAIHDAVGLGTFPESLLTEYLTRSASLLYGGWGIVYLYVSRDVNRYLDFLRFLCRMVGLFAVAMLMLDLWLGMPIIWTLGEGPFVLVHVVVLWFLLERQASLQSPPPRGGREQY